MDIRKKKYRISMLHSTELKKVNKLKWPSEEVSVTLGREESNHKGGSKGGTWEEKWTVGGGDLQSPPPAGRQTKYLSVITLTCNCSGMKE